jgi:hypothetical protein
MRSGCWAEATRWPAFGGTALCAGAALPGAGARALRSGAEDGVGLGASARRAAETDAVGVGGDAGSDLQPTQHHVAAMLKAVQVRGSSTELALLADCARGCKPLTTD